MRAHHTFINTMKLIEEKMDSTQLEEKDSHIKFLKDLMILLMLTCNPPLYQCNRNDRF